MQTDPEGDPPWASHTAAGRGAAPRDEARAAFAGDKVQVGAPPPWRPGTALRVAGMTVGHEGADRGARLSVPSFAGKQETGTRAVFPSTGFATRAPDVFS